MSDDNSNPYASPEAEPKETQTRPSLWRFMLLVVCMLVGGLSSVVGLLAIGLMSFLLFTDRGLISTGEMIAGCFLYLGFGGAWLWAAWCFWRRKDLWGVLALVIGCCIPLILFMIFGV